jgi:pimeloyl-ACP methyl ester carboxylesterase
MSTPQNLTVNWTNVPTRTITAGGVPTKNTHDLARRLPNSNLIIYPDAGHGGVFQFHADFVPKALEFLAR